MSSLSIWPENNQPPVSVKLIVALCAAILLGMLFFGCSSQSTVVGPVTAQDTTYVIPSYVDVVEDAPEAYNPSRRFFELVLADEESKLYMNEWFQTGIPSYMIPEIWIDCAYLTEDLGPGNVVPFWNECVNRRHSRRLELPIHPGYYPPAYVNQDLSNDARVDSIATAEWNSQRSAASARGYYRFPDVFIVCAFEAEREQSGDPSDYWVLCVNR